ncbi:MAG: Fe-S cluster assembly protein SufD [Paludibacteraceae bacterium]|nr:Fe-S cluster assembly protein SufD [Paludibacteraceae bacterium]
MKNQVLEIYKSQKELLCSRSASIFNDGRDEAYEALKANEFPSTRTEAYRYCPLFDRMDCEWGVNLHRTRFGIKVQDMFRCAIPGIKATIGYMLNDVWGGGDNDILLGGGAFVCSMRHATVAHTELVDKYYGKALKDKDDAFVAINALLVQDGFFVYVPVGVSVTAPLQMVNMLWSGNDMLVINRNLVVLERGASLHLIDCDHSMDENRYFAMRTNEVIVSDNASFSYTSMESTRPSVTNLRRFAVSQAKDSRVNMGSFGISNGATRNHIEIDLNGEGAETWLGGVLLTRDTERSENYTIIRHHVSHGTSNELYKYILDGESRAGFSGRIVVDHGAQQTVSYQTNRNVLLSENARIMGRPQLEIYADDVKCGHGATTGMLDEAAIFYMRQRGIGLDEARMLLLQAFSADVIDHIDFPALQDRLRILIEKRLRNESVGCVNCLVK